MSEPAAIVKEERKRRRRTEVRAIIIAGKQRVEKAGDSARQDAADAAAEGQSKSLPEPDVFSKLAGQLVVPPYDLQTLALLSEQSSVLGPLIEAMETNVDGFGHRLTCHVNLDDDKIDDALKRQCEIERRQLDNFFLYVSPDESFTSLRRRTRRDLESTGNAYWEVIRNRRAEIVALKHLPAHMMRLSMEDREHTRVDQRFRQVDDDGNPVLDERVIYRRFRRFVQGQILLFGVGGETTLRTVWFRQFGDPRTLDNETGEYVSPEKVEAFEDDEGNVGPMPEHRRASEAIHFKLYSPRGPYGVPRYIGNLVGILGARSAQEINFFTLRNNNIPSMVVAVSNGQLTEGTIERMEEFVEEHIQGSDNYSRFLIVEGESAYEGEEQGQVKIDIKPLTEVQHTDALFAGYIDSENQRTRLTFRLPSLFIGKDESLNRATAEIARKLADENVFAPERAEADWVWNALILPDLGARFHTFASRTPNVTDNKELVSMLSAAERTGGITPRISREIIEDVFPGAAEAPPIDPDKLDPDVPFSLQMAAAVQSQADPSEPNQIGPPTQPSGKVPGVDRRTKGNDSVAEGIRRQLVAELLDTGDRAGAELRKLMRDDEAEAE